MKIILVMLTFVYLATLVISCGGDREDPFSASQLATEYGGQLTLGGGRVNTPVSEENKLVVCQILNSEVFGLCLRALGGIGDTPQAMDTMLVTRISGAYSGYAQVQGNRKLRQDQKTFDFNFHVSLYDFSDSGSVFMGGELGASGFLTIEDGMFTNARLYLSDGLAFTGNYTGALEYNSMKMPVNTCNELSSVLAQAELTNFTLEGGSQTLIYGDTHIRFNPYFREEVTDTVHTRCYAF
jgi:hypothetical protein